MPQTPHAELIILGGGVAGCEAALRATRQGVAVTLVEPGFLGGTCINSGCVPTKYLLGATAHLHSPHQSWGGAAVPAPENFTALQEKKNTYIAACRKQLEATLLQSGVTLLRGKGSFLSRQSIQVKGPGLDTTRTFSRCIIATGSAPASFPLVKPDGAALFGSSTALNLKTVPKSLLLIGGGAIGIELGAFLHRLGTKITIVDRIPCLLPGEEPEIGATLRAFYEKQGWDFALGSDITSLTTVNGQALAVLSDTTAITAGGALIAVGRKPATEGMALEAAQIPATPRGFIATNEFLAATENIYAVGDANGRVLLANAGIDQARYVADRITGTAMTPYVPALLPACIYGTLETMRVGPTAKALRDAGEDVAVSRAFFSGNHISQSHGYPEGFVKAVWAGDRLASVSAIGYGCSQLGTAAALLVEKRIQRGNPMGVAIAVPTLDQTLEDALAAPLEEHT